MSAPRSDLAAGEYVRPASTLDSLAQMYGPNVNLVELSTITRQSAKTIQNGISRGDYPIPSFKIGRKHTFRLIDVAAYLDRQFAATNNASNADRQAGETTQHTDRRNVRGGR